MKNIIIIASILSLVGCSNLLNKNDKTSQADSSRLSDKAREVASAQEEELILQGNSIPIFNCKIPKFRRVYESDIITLIQSKDVFFRIVYGDDADFYPIVVITNTDHKGMAHSNPVKFERCDLVKKCIDQFANESIGVASSCDKAGVFRVDFFQR